MFAHVANFKTITIYTPHTDVTMIEDKPSVTVLFIPFIRHCSYLFSVEDLLSNLTFINYQACNNK